ncbi:MAG: PIN domain-containing protein [Intrasporangium sp.]|uniref:PIN domain-containing protein n=1 Tax=Intrasporangium sp. TaxID=1925024 RepID=UPI002648C8C3|nr:PIN domain-containing protein [Intrasporangium sp.]MDN5796860.1 PIN domain-containing protein [Intrasporangium sp.]
MSGVLGVEAGREWLLRARRDTGRLATSPVCIAEVAGGMRAPGRREVTRLLSSLDVFPVTRRVGWQAAQLMHRYQRSHSGIGLGDYLVAATVEAEGLELATLNVKHFPMFRGLKPPFRLPTTG